MEFEALKGLLRRVAEEVEAEIRQVERELAEARRVSGRSCLRLETFCMKTSGLELRRRSTPISRSYSPKMERRLKSSRRLKNAYTASGLR